MTYLAVKRWTTCGTEYDVAGKPESIRPPFLVATWSIYLETPTPQTTTLITSRSLPCGWGTRYRWGEMMRYPYLLGFRQISNTSWTRYTTEARRQVADQKHHYAVRTALCIRYSTSYVDVSTPKR